MAWWQLLRAANVFTAEVMQKYLAKDVYKALQSAINSGEVHRYILKPWRHEELVNTLQDAFLRIDDLNRMNAAGQDYATLVTRGVSVVGVDPA